MFKLNSVGLFLILIGWQVSWDILSLFCPWLMSHGGSSPHLLAKTLILIHSWEDFNFPSLAATKPHFPLKLACESLIDSGNARKLVSLESHSSMATGQALAPRCTCVQSRYLLKACSPANSHDIQLLVMILLGAMDYQSYLTLHQSCGTDCPFPFLGHVRRSSMVCILDHCFW